MEQCRYFWWKCSSVGCHRLMAEVNDMHQLHLIEVKRPREEKSFPCSIISMMVGLMMFFDCGGAITPDADIVTCSAHVSMDDIIHVLRVPCSSSNRSHRTDRSQHVDLVGLFHRCRCLSAAELRTGDSGRWMPINTGHSRPALSRMHVQTHSVVRLHR